MDLRALAPLLCLWPALAGGEPVCGDGPWLVVEVRIGRNTIEALVGDPMPGVRVRAGGFEATTDARGQARLPATRGRSVVDASAPKGYAIRGARREVTLEPEQCQAQVGFDVHHANAIRGRVTGGRAEVRLRGREELERFAIAEGTYAFEELEPGEYEVAVAADGATVERRPFPALGAVRVKVVAGAGEVTRDLVAPVLAPRAVEGVVLLPDRRPVAGVPVRYGVHGEQATYEVPTDADGRFGFSAYEGIAYDVQVTGFDRRTISQRDHATARIAARGKPRRLELRIRRWDR